MAACSNFAKTIVLMYIAAVGYLAFYRIYIKSCPHDPSGESFQRLCVAPFWQKADTQISMKIFVGKTVETKSLVWSSRSHSIADKLVINVSFPFPTNVMPTDDSYSAWIQMWIDPKGPVVNFDFKIAEKRPRKIWEPTRNLLNGSSSESSISHRQMERPQYSLHWKFGRSPAILRYAIMHELVDRPTYLDVMGMPMQTIKNSPSFPADDGRVITDKMYLPQFWIDDLSITSKHYVPFLPRPSPTDSDDDTDAQFTMHFAPTSVLHFFIRRSVYLSMRQLSSLLGNSDEMMDEIRYYLSEDKIYTLLFTQLVGWLHVMFEYLAFQDDWKFFKGRKNFKGISSSSLLYSVFRSIVIFLYLHHLDTSWLVLGSLLKDILYESWKLYKIFQPEIVFYSFGILTIPGGIAVRNLSLHGDQEEKDCVAYDRIASVHAGLCLSPLIVGLSAYYLNTYTYTSWYSWFISTLVDCVYFFGFLALLPQLYINYRLKSVAHLPMKAFMYKIFSTFIDDIFAFVIKMPLKHKVMTLRDDIVFFGFLYQWWIYPSDKNRTNEFGFQYEDEGSSEEPDAGELLVIGKKDLNEERSRNEIGDGSVQAEYELTTNRDKLD